MAVAVACQAESVLGFHRDDAKGLKEMDYY